MMSVSYTHLDVYKRQLLGPVSFPSGSRQTKDIVYKFNVQAALIMEKTATVQTDSDMVCSICI